MSLKFRNVLTALITTLCTMCVLCGISMSVSATSYQGILCDDAGVLHQDESSEVIEQLQQTAERLEINVAVVISDQADSYTARNYADTYQESLFGVNSDSILYLINTNDGYDYITTSGVAIDDYSDSTINYILQSTSGEYLTDSNMMNYYMAICTFCELVYDERGSSDTGFITIICFFISAVISLLVCGGIAGSYKTHASTSAKVYAQTNEGKIEFTRREDAFVRTFTSKREISHGGGSSTHTSSGGGTHGGGGFHR